MIQANQLFFTFKIMASLTELREEVETLKTALASSNEEIERLKQILSDNLPNWETGAFLPHTMDPNNVCEPQTMSKLTKEDIERYTSVPHTEFRCPQIQQTAHSSRAESWRSGKVEGHLQQKNLFLNQF